MSAVVAVVAGGSLCCSRMRTSSSAPQQRKASLRLRRDRNNRTTENTGVCGLRSSMRQRVERWPRVSSTDGDDAGEGPSTTPSQAEDEEVPLWVRREQAKELNEQKQDGEIPFGVYLLASCIVAIAAIASIFEYTYQNAIFSVIPPSSFLYKPILGIFVFTGLPLAGFLFFKAIKSANELSESMDKMDNMR